MVFLTMVDIWRETVEELGGLRGFFYIFLVMVVFTLIVQWAVGRASATRAAKRMNRQRMRKLRYDAAARLHPGDRPRRV